MWPFTSEIGFRMEWKRFTYFLFVALLEMTTFPSVSNHEREDATANERKERHKATAASPGQQSAPGLPESREGDAFERTEVRLMLPKGWWILGLYSLEVKKQWKHLALHIYIYIKKFMDVNLISEADAANFPAWIWDNHFYSRNWFTEVFNFRQPWVFKLFSCSLTLPGEKRKLLCQWHLKGC